MKMELRMEEYKLKFNRYVIPLELEPKGNEYYEIEMIKIGDKYFIEMEQVLKLIDVIR